MNARGNSCLHRARKTCFFVLIGVTCFLFSTPRTWADTVFVTGYFDGTLGVIPSTGSPHTLTGFNGPSGLAFDGSGNLYLSNYGSATINKISNPSGVSPTISVVSSNLDCPVGLAFDSSGNLFVANNSTDVIVKIDPQGNKSVFASVTWQTTGFVVGLAFDQAGYLYVCTSGSSGGPAFGGPGWILQYDTHGNLVSSFRSGTVAPIGLAFDQSGNLYATDFLGGTIEKFITPSTRGLVSPTVLTSGLSHPNGIAVDSGGNFYVAGLGNLYEINSSGQVISNSSRNGFPYAIAVQVPEPATWALVALGSGAFLLSRRLRRY
jgi:sugar lactone lactonase YvrE